MELNEQINKIRSMNRVLNEDIMPVDMTADVFLKRVPFFKTYNNNSTPKAVGFQKGVYNSNVELYEPKEGDTYIFPNFNTFSDFSYSKWALNGKFQYVFKLENELIVTKPQNMDSFVFTAINIANRMKSRELSYSKEFLIPDQTLPPQLLDQVINDLNKCLFGWEEFVNEKMGLNLKSPVD